MHALVYVIVLNYNGRHHLEYCLPSLVERVSLKILT